MMKGWAARGVVAVLALAGSAWGGVDRTSVRTYVIWFNTDPQVNDYVFTTFDLELWDELTPKTVINFKKYIAAGEYEYSIIHRSAAYEDGTPFVIQGGGYWVSDDGDDTITVRNVADFGYVPNEFRAGVTPNARGTISMARLGEAVPDGQGGTIAAIDTASSEWFINVSNNTVLDDPTSPYTAFGEVTQGMDVVDGVAALPVYDFRYGTDPAHGALREVPLMNYAQNDYYAGVPLQMGNLMYVVMEVLAEPLLADMNGDEATNALDIGHFVMLLTSHAYEPQGDMNQDGAVNALDIGGFVRVLTGAGEAAGAAVPEPASAGVWALAGGVWAAMGGRRARSRDSGERGVAKLPG